MTTGAQIKAGRRLLKWQHRILAARSDVSLAMLAEVERLESEVPAEFEPAAAAMRRTLEAEGVEFQADGGVAKAGPDAPTITPDQIKAARKLLGWSAATLAKWARRTILSVAQAEQDILPPRNAGSTLRAIQAAFESGGVEFTNDGQPGVRKKKVDEA